MNFLSVHFMKQQKEKSNNGVKSSLKSELKKPNGMHTGNSSPTGRWWMSVIGAAGSASLDLFPFAISRNSSVYSFKWDAFSCSPWFGGVNFGFYAQVLYNEWTKFQTTQLKNQKSKKIKRKQKEIRTEKFKTVKQQQHWHQNGISCKNIWLGILSDQLN